MPSSIVPLIVSLLFSQRMRKYARANNLSKWEQLFTGAIFVYSLLFVAGLLFQDQNFIWWIWDALLLAMVGLSLKQNQFRSLRMYVWAFIPYVIAVVATDVIKLVNTDLFSSWERYISTARLLGLIWMGALLFSQNKQTKSAEKERIKKQREDELNRAIAVRKVELEGLVAERTAELTGQKEELQRTLTELRSTQTQLIHSEKMASLGELTAGIAHEIQNPLNFVNNFSEVSNELLIEMKTELAKGNATDAIAIADDVQQNLDKIIHHGKRADAIVKGMLQHSRASTGKKELFDINALADEYLRLAYHGLRAKDKSFNATLKTDFDPALGKLEIIPQDIGRVILNLLTNAFYAVTEKKKLTEKKTRPSDSSQTSNLVYEPTVTLTTKKTSNGVEISVGDNGNGIPKDVMDKIFQPFFTTKPTGQGTGLGLSMSFDIVKKGHGGELKVKTEAEEGTMFTIFLPKQAL